MPAPQLGLPKQPRFFKGPLVSLPDKASYEPLQKVTYKPPPLPPPFPYKTPDKAPYKTGYKAASLTNARALPDAVHKTPAPNLLYSLAMHELFISYSLTNH